MKKILCMLVALPLSILFTSCDKENGTDDTGSGSGNSAGKIYKVIYSSGLAGTDNFLFYDMSVTYLDANGEWVEQKVLSYPLTIELENVRPPFTAKITPVYDLKKKEDIKTDKTTFTLSEIHINLGYSSSDDTYFGSYTGSMTAKGIDNAYELVKLMVSEENGVTDSLAVGKR